MGAKTLGMESGRKKRRKEIGKDCSRIAGLISPTQINKKTHKTSIKILYGNVQSVIGKQDELCSVIYDLCPGVICPNETWVNSTHSNSLLQLDGYDIVC